MAFYQRILVASWGIFLLTMAISLSAVHFAPGSDESADKRIVARLVQQVARDLSAGLAEDPDNAVEALLTRQNLSLAPLLEIYVIDPAGDDVLARALPRRIAEVYTGKRQHSSPMLHVDSPDLRGYTIIGDDQFFPLAQVLVRPGGRTFMLAVGLAVSALISILLARFIVLPVRRIREAGRRVADGDLSVRVAHTVGNRSDDIASLARDFDRMTEQVEGLLQDQQRLMRDVSHELRSPLARLLALISIARQRAAADDAPASTEQLDRMERELDRVDELISSILAFAQLDHADALHRQPIDLVDLLENVVDDASLEAHAEGKEVQLLAGSEPLVMPLDGAIASAFENVVRNAVRHTAPDSRVEVSIARTDAGVTVTVDDQGPGVPPEAITQLFAPFFRVEEGRGTRSGSGGLGLAIAERCMRLHGGAIAAVNRPEGGLRVTMSLPRAAEAASAG
ncbi:MAG: ATP-binding protein [Pseudomonadota bacterium]